MFLKSIHIDRDSYIEVSDRITSNGIKMQISLRGSRDDDSATIISAILDEKEAALLSTIITQWVSGQKSQDGAE